MLLIILSSIFFTYLSVLNGLLTLLIGEEISSKLLLLVFQYGLRTKTLFRGEKNSILSSEKLFMRIVFWIV